MLQRLVAPEADQALQRADCTTEPRTGVLILLRGVHRRHGLPTLVQIDIHAAHRGDKSLGLRCRLGLQNIVRCGLRCGLPVRLGLIAAVYSFSFQNGLSLITGRGQCQVCGLLVFFCYLSRFWRHGFGGFGGTRWILPRVWDASPLASSSCRGIGSTTLCCTACCNARKQDRRMLKECAPCNECRHVSLRRLGSLSLWPMAYRWSWKGRGDDSADELSKISATAAAPRRRTT